MVCFAVGDIGIKVKREEVFLHFRAKAAAKREAVTMPHFGEVFSAEIYARGGIVVGGVKRAEGSCGAETPKSAWGSARG